MPMRERATDMPTPRLFDWPQRLLKHAHTSFVQLPDGRVELEVRHNTLKHVTPDMLAWWFSVYPFQKVTHEGATFQAFLLWHLRDHIAITPSDPQREAPQKPGDRFAIEEAFACIPRYRGTEHVTVSQCDSSVYAVSIHRLGILVAALRYDFQAADTGTDVVTRLWIGAERGPFRSLVNNWIVSVFFDTSRSEAWMQHNVEEVGNLDMFLPDLYAKRAEGTIIQIKNLPAP
ncbi:DAPG hydrolase family protein [Shimia sp.]|uniref:DAPG hydrolase family protein n=1 Tax=Shimia sp. TaxID=1954381 RepID=UPI003B8D847B